MGYGRGGAKIYSMCYYSYRVYTHRWTEASFQKGNFQPAKQMREQTYTLPLTRVCQPITYEITGPNYSGDCCKVQSPVSSSLPLCPLFVVSRSDFQT